MGRTHWCRVILTTTTDHNQVKGTAFLNTEFYTTSFSNGAARYSLQGSYNFADLFSSIISFFEVFEAMIVSQMFPIPQGHLKLFKYQVANYTSHAIPRISTYKKHMLTAAKNSNNGKHILSPFLAFWPVGSHSVQATVSFKNSLHVYEKVSTLGCSTTKQKRC